MDSIINLILPSVSILATLITLITGIYSLKKNVNTRKFNEDNIEIEIQRSSIDFQPEKSSVSKSDRISFEASKLSEYYSQVLSQSKISFWFSLIFASIGFTVMSLEL